VIRPYRLEDVVMKAPSFVVPVAVRSMTLAAAAMAIAAPAHAQWSSVIRNPSSASSPNTVRIPTPARAGTAVYEWQGRVDQEIRLQLRDSRANVIRVGSRETIANGGRALSAIPRQPGQLTIERLEGRGSVDVIQQPTAQNGYTAMVRMVDGDAGAGAYHLIAYWQPTGGYGNGGNGGYGTGGGNTGGSRGGRDGNEGYGRSGASDGGYDRDGYDRGGYDRGGYNRGGYDRGGYDRGGYDRNGRDRRGGYRNGNGGNARGHAYGHDKQDARDDRRDDRDDRADKRDDRRDKRDDKQDKKDEKRDRKDDKRDDRKGHGDHH
jgi:hypothetical protein